ncbi:MAG: zinc-dependent alcohol dehydrogenase family protein [Candidatus Aminicenantes bacterium]|nr:zinc-dependent alcohol dehydrogenase family protein [Candidatus Aminicenantes bacterium]
MKAMILRQFGPIEKNPLELAEMPAPQPGAEDILIKVNVCGVCHTDLHTVEGELPEAVLPVIPGHQVVGIVEGAGQGTGRFKKGDRIGAAWLHYACGKCAFCLSGRENLCENGRFTGYHVNGGYAEYMTIPEKFAYAIPEIFTDEEASPLLCAGIIGYRALRLSNIRPGGCLGLYGFGASAHVAIQVAVHWGCRVYVFSRSKKHQDLARKLGAAWTGTAQEVPPKKTNSAIIFAPAGPLVLDALLNTEKGGTVALAGIYMTPIPEMDYQKYLYHERTLRSVANATRQDGEELLKIAAEIPIRTTTRIFPLAEANKVLCLLKEGQISGSAVLKI